MPESVTYVPGMECHLCARMGILIFFTLPLPKPPVWSQVQDDLVPDLVPLSTQFSVVEFHPGTRGFDSRQRRSGTRAKLQHRLFPTFMVLGR
jgi:hypothetical protein